MKKYPSAEESVPVQSSEIEEPRCPRDNFPMLMINGKLQCSVEYLDRCVGGQTVVDMVRKGQTVYYVFANGHQLPLLCACCGKSLAVPDLDRERKKIQGRHLEAMSMVRRVTEDGYEYNELTLEFSKSGALSLGMAQDVSFDVAIKMKHPANCPYQKKAPPSKRKKRSRQKGRRKR
jgi:hypothetical protein